MPRASVLARILTLDPEEDHCEIVMLDYSHEFYPDLMCACGYALLRTLAVPRISTLLDHSVGLRPRGKNRNADAAALLRDLFLNGYDSQPGREAIRQINRSHRSFEIDNKDMLYVLSVFIFEPIRWMDRVGWRQMTAQERLATFYFWREVGRRMAISELPTDFGAFEVAIQPEWAGGGRQAGIG